MNFKGGKIEKKCLKCNNIFLIYPGNISSKYCSKKCAFSDLSRTRKIIETRLKNGNSYTDENERKATIKFSDYRISAKRKNRKFDFDKDIFVNKVLKCCYYCGTKPALGVDRKDPFIGYTLNNSAPCCSLCNFAKHTMTEKEFKNHIKRIYKYFIKK